MEEKKQTKKWSYSPVGKAVRGFLCLVTFGILIGSLTFLLYGVLFFGTHIIYEPKSEYFKTSYFWHDFYNESVDVMYTVQDILSYENGKEFTITDVAGEKIYYYDTDRLVNDGYNITGNDLLNFENYIKKKENIENEFTNYTYAVSYLKEHSGSNEYLYFDESAFKAFFEENGAVNTNHRFSADFSEYAYFLFDDRNEKMLEQGLVQENPAWEQELGVEVSLEENESEDLEIEETGVIVTWDGANGHYDITDVEYAVYDPKADLFYSTWDDYFKPNDCYIYDIADLLAMIETEYSMSGNRINSLLIPLLKITNYGALDMPVSDYICDEYEWYKEGMQQLKNRAGSGFLYYIEGGGFLYTNVEKIEDISAQDYAYQLGENQTLEGITSNAKQVIWENYSELEEIFEMLPEGTICYFGIDTARDTNGISEITLHQKNYDAFASHSILFLLIAGVSGILVIFQAIWLIITTGKTKKGEKEVHLNPFDRFPTELWLILCGSLLLSGILYAVTLTMEMSLDDIWFVSKMGVLATLPFALFFMILTLSFARRMKAHNLWSGFYIRILWRKILEPCKQFYYRRKGTERLFVAFVFYVLMEMFCILMFLSGDFLKTGMGVICFLLLQMAAGSLIYSLMKDITSLSEGIEKIANGDMGYRCQVSKKNSLLTDLRDGINHIGDGLEKAVETSLKDERMKTELITNVSHDLKTPLTSIINYIDLLKKEEMATEAANHYITVLESKAQRLKHLTEDLVEAAKANTGNIEMEKMPLAFDELMRQAIGEFEDKFATRNLNIIAEYPKEPAVILADGRRLFRIMENLLQNAYKYALEGTRIYADLSNKQGIVTFTMKNVSAAPLNISPDELMERFTRGDSSRTTEGSGLGLSIARDLTKLQEGTFDILLDGDLFKVIVAFPEYYENEVEPE